MVTRASFQAIGLFILAALSSVVFSCTWKDAPERSILVIAVENLGFGSFSCFEGAEVVSRSGFQVLCDEGVRFTHAYTTSTMSQAAMASLFTARYAHQHDVRHNGTENLPASSDTLAELALARGYRTSFFSGGPPIWRRSGLGQGFEVFDDTIDLSVSSLYRPASEVIRLYTSWRTEEVEGENTLSFLYLADLQFSDVATVNSMGEVRESSFNSQLEALDEALGDLFKDMKRRKIWDHTDIFLVGLQAEPAHLERPGEFSALNLFSEATRVTLMIKPARKSRDGGFNWKIDPNVSLIDVGATLRELVGASSLGEDAGAVSLVASLAGPQAALPLDRIIITESAWGKWRGLSEIRMAVRYGPYLLFHDERPRLYNTLTDNNELNPIPLTDPQARTMRGKWYEFSRQHGVPPFRHPPYLSWERLSLAKEIWRSRTPSPEAIARLRQLSQKLPEDRQLRQWRASLALRMGDWSDLKATAQQLPKEPLWQFVAERNQGVATQTIKHLLPDDPCLKFLSTRFGGIASASLNVCRIEGLNDLLDSVNEGLDEEARARALEQFMRVYNTRALMARVAEKNWQTGKRWAAIALQDGPELLDLLLALPEFRKIRALLRK